MLHIAAIVLAILIIVVGLIGAALPYLPGLPLAFLGTILLGHLTRYQYFDHRWFWLFGLLTLASLACDHLAGFLGSRWGRASIYGTIGAIVGSLIGVIFFGLWGIILAPALGVLLFEYAAKRDHLHAVHVAKTTLLTSIMAVAVNAILAIIFAITLSLLLIF